MTYQPDAETTHHTDLCGAVLKQFERATSYLDLSEGVKNFLRVPKRELTVNFPVQMDNGNIEQFIGYRVHHSTVLGPTMGGVRYMPTIDLDMVRALAMRTTWQCALVNLPYGGAKGAVMCDPAQLSTAERERLTRRYASEISVLIRGQSDVPAPDLGTDAQTIAWMMDTYSLVTGRSIPSLITGNPNGNKNGHKNEFNGQSVQIVGSLDRADATGLGVAICMEEALCRVGLDHPAQIRIAIQGFGSVGRWVARHAVAMEYRVVAVSDVSGGIYDANGLDVDDVIAYAAANVGGVVAGYPSADTITNADLLALECDVLVPCALENQITRHNAADVRAFLIVEGATGPVTPGADVLFKRRDVTVIPDILANAGGVIVSYFEWVQGLQSFLWDAREVQRQLRRVLLKAYEDMLRTRYEFGVTHRTAAQITAIKRVSEAVSMQGLCP